MELWIRSQDKINLIKLNHIYVDVPLLNGSTAIIGLLSGKTNRVLGYYRTKERALKVLDEIQRLMKASLVDKNLDGYGVVIYEMPNE